MSGSWSWSRSRSWHNAVANLKNVPNSFAPVGEVTISLEDSTFTVMYDGREPLFEGRRSGSKRLFHTIKGIFIPSEKGARIASATHGTPVRKEYLKSMTSGCGEISVTTTPNYNPPGVASRIEVSINTTENLSAGQVMDLIRRVLNIFGKE